MKIRVNNLERVRGFYAKIARRREIIKGDKIHNEEIYKDEVVNAEIYKEEVVKEEVAKEKDIGPAREWDETKIGDGTEHPSYIASSTANRIVERTFCFIDIAGFTSYTHVNGPSKALELVDMFRTTVKDVASARGVRIAKWLGDGVMMLSVEAGTTIATAAHLSAHFKKIGIEMRTGIATGEALFLDGDDYVGEPVNLAAKLAAVVETGDILAYTTEEDVPDWVEVVEKTSVEIRGIGRVEGVLRLRANLGD